MVGSQGVLKRRSVANSYWWYCPYTWQNLTHLRPKCDKLATELSWQRFAPKVDNFQLRHLHLTHDTCIWCLHWGDPVWVLPRFLAPENSPWAIMWRCSRDPTFSRFSRTPTCDRRTDERTDRQTDTTTASAGKNQPIKQNSLNNEKVSILLLISQGIRWRNTWRNA